MLPRFFQPKGKSMRFFDSRRDCISVVIIILIIFLVFSLTSESTFVRSFSSCFNGLYRMQQESLKTAEEDRENLRIMSKLENNTNFYQSVKLEAFCGNLKRIGSAWDGGKFVCNPKAARTDDCVILSLGLHNQIDFDQDIYKTTGKQCTLLGADKDPQNPETQSSYGKLGGQLFVGMIPKDITISRMMETAGKRKVEILKIDIEGAEHVALEPFLKEYPVCQILIEVHGTPAEHLRMLQTMAKFNFRIFDVDPNPACKHCCEYSLINEKCMGQFGASPLAITIPREDA